MACAHRRSREVEQFARRQIFLANLHPVNTCCHNGADFFNKRLDRVVSGESFAVRHVADNGRVSSG